TTPISLAPGEIKDVSIILKTQAGRIGKATNLAEISEAKDGNNNVIDGQTGHNKDEDSNYDDDPTNDVSGGKTEDDTGTASVDAPASDKPASFEKFISNVWRDANGDGIVDPDETVYDADEAQPDAGEPGYAPQSVRKGDYVTFRLEVRNNGENRIFATKIEDWFDPALYTFADTSGNWDVAGTTYVHDHIHTPGLDYYEYVGPPILLEPEGSTDGASPPNPTDVAYVEITLQVSATYDGTLTNRARVTAITPPQAHDPLTTADESLTPDTNRKLPTPGDDEADARPEVFDLSLKKALALYQGGTADSDPLTSPWLLATQTPNRIADARLVEFVLTVTNEGNMPAVATKIIDYIPAGLLFVDLGAQIDPSDPGSPTYDDVYGAVSVGGGRTVREINAYWAQSAPYRPAVYDWGDSANAAGDPTNAPLLQPGESVAVPIVLLTDPEPDPDRLGAIVNLAEIMGVAEPNPGYDPSRPVNDDPTDPLYNPEYLPVEDADSAYDPDIDGDGIPNEDDDDVDGDGIPNNEDGTVDGLADEDDLGRASIETIPVAVVVQADKDTIKQTAAMYDTTEGDKAIYTNTDDPDDSFMYDVNFRSMSTVRLDEFLVTDPLEGENAGIAPGLDGKLGTGDDLVVDNQGHPVDKVIFEEIWTPVAWGDVDGYVDILYQTNLTEQGAYDPQIPTKDGDAYGPASGNTGKYDNIGFKRWPSTLQNGLPATTPAGANRPLATTRYHLYMSDITLGAGEYLTAIRFSYGKVRVGFTTQNYRDKSINTEQRDLSGEITLDSKDDLLELDGDPEAGAYQTLALPGQTSYQVLATSFGTGVANKTEGITRNYVDWTPKVTDPFYSREAAQATGLMPANYLVRASRASSGAEQIDSSVSVVGSRGLGGRVPETDANGNKNANAGQPSANPNDVYHLSDKNSDAVRTTVFETITVLPKETTPLASYEGRMPKEVAKTETTPGDVVTVGSSGQTAKTGDAMNLRLMILLMAASAAAIALLALSRRRRRRGEGSALGARSLSLLLCAVVLTATAFAAFPGFAFAASSGGGDTVGGVSGVLTDKEYKDLKKKVPGLKGTKTELTFERQVDKDMSFPNADYPTALDRNDVSLIPTQVTFDVTDADSPSGTAKAALTLAEISFTVATRDASGFPTSYTAQAVYRGIETYKEGGYWLVDDEWSDEIKTLSKKGETTTVVVGSGDGGAAAAAATAARTGTGGTGAGDAPAAPQQAGTTKSGEGATGGVASEGAGGAEPPAAEAEIGADGVPLSGDKAAGDGDGASSAMTTQTRVLITILCIVVAAAILLTVIARHRKRAQLNTSRGS
ncbi:MAG: hypothetical protein LBR00_03015, partial [Clostridiales Family XIII bacterium]|nr:hypothetical protein [Clostridiales Family XIII bacterium]